MFTTVGLIAKREDERVAETLETLVKYLQSVPCTVLLDAESGIVPGTAGLPVVDRAALGEACDLIIVVAGDGTFLGAARSLVPYGVPLLGINLGRLGFLSDIMPHEMTERLGHIFAGRCESEERFLLHATIERDGERLLDLEALNEVAVHKWNIARLLTIETLIDSRLVNRQRSDGLIVATPTGSTAYALSGGGPILHPQLDAVVLVPICPHTLSSRPLVVSGGSRIELRMDAQNRSEAQLTCDGQTVLELAPGDRIQIRRAERPIRLIHPEGYDYFATLRAKLHWGREL